MVGNEPTLLAAYTCTPLVEFPLSDLKPGAKVKGKTIAELGNRNRPIDMIVYQKDGTDNIEHAESITSPVRDKKGQPYETIESWKGIDHLDKLDAQNAVVVRRGD